MNKRVFLWVTLMMVAVLSSAQTKKINVKLNESIELEGCVLRVTELLGDDGDNPKVRIQLEHDGQNLSNRYMIFPKVFSEKELKKEKVIIDEVPMIIVWHKTNPSQYLTTKAVKGVTSIMVLQPNGHARIATIDAYKSDNKVCFNLPIYVAQSKDKKFLSPAKVMIFNFQDYILNIDVEQKPDETYNNLKNEYDKLAGKLGNSKCCSNSKHTGTTTIGKTTWLSKSEWDKLKGKRDEKVKEIDDIINNIKKNFNKANASTIFDDYNGLRSQYLALEFDKKKDDCGGHPNQIVCQEKIHGKPCGAKYDEGKQCPNINKHDPQPVYITCKVCGKKYKKGENCPGPHIKCTCGGYDGQTIYDKIQRLALDVNNAPNLTKKAKEVYPEAKKWYENSNIKCPKHPYRIGKHRKGIDDAWKKIIDNKKDSK